ncbi:hypothetical protein E2C01_057090 [Portunus trituberculatus]|uniref:Uncharacterized protein n=1 Tax=Portunus trituberculatus TaxID=210409 RepID=A0A5B7H1E3_PORTR|nr:hypothetical protein [Portunus trituberculatus]
MVQGKREAYSEEEQNVTSVGKQKGKPAWLVRRGNQKQKGRMCGRAIPERGDCEDKYEQYITC